MTGPNPPLTVTASTGDNNTTQVKVDVGPPSIWMIIPGVLVFLVGGVILYAEIRIALATKVEPHIWHLLSGAVICIAGVIIPFYKQAGPGLKSLSVLVAPYVPRIGGGRPGDPPAAGQ
jgi:hypothetical protein